MAHVTVARTAAIAVLLAVALPAWGADPPAPDLAGCGERVDAAPLDYDSWNCYWEYWHATEDLEAALRELRAARARHGGEPLGAVFLADLLSRSDSAAAERLLREAVDALSAREDPAEARARSRLVHFLARRMRLDEAEEQLAWAKAVLHRDDDPEARLMLKYRETLVAMNGSELSRGWLVSREIESDPDFHRLRVEDQVAILVMASNAARHLGFVDQAYRVAAESQRIARVSGQPHLIAVADNAALHVALDLDGVDPMDVLAQAERALSDARRHRLPVYELDALHVVAVSSRGRDALDRLEEVRRLALRSQCTDIAIDALTSEAGALYEVAPESFVESFRLLDQALSLALEFDNPVTSMHVLSEIASLRRKTGPRDAAVTDHLAAIEASENCRALQGLDELRARFHAKHLFPYYSLIGELLSGEDGGWEDREHAFRISERFRARVLLDHMLRTSGNDAPDALRELAAERAGLQSSIAQLRLHLGAAGDPHEREALAVELERLERREALLRDRIAREEAPDVWREPVFASIDDVQKVLAFDEAILSFVMAPEAAGASWLFVLTAADVRVYRLPAATEVEPAVWLWLGLIESGDEFEARGAAKLHGKLIGSALDELPEEVRHLVVVPDGVLHRLPFAALRPRVDAQPLGARWTFSTAPSATVWIADRSGERRDVPGRALVLADPWRPGAVGDGLVRAAPFVAATLDRLPHARDEGRRVVATLGGGGTLRVGRLASEAFLKSAALERYGVLHFATHAVVDEHSVERSAIVLSGGAGEDGLLQPAEIEELPLRRQIVTLAACRSGSGPVLGGEGVMGLARSFLQAGAGTVVATLWPLRDDDAAELFGRFYARVDEGLTVAEALAATQRELIERGAPASAWAGVVAIGDAGVGVEPAPGKISPVVVTAAVASLAVLLLLWRRRRIPAGARR